MDKYMEKHHSKFSRLMEWIYQLVVINVLALIATLAGLVVFGFFPALMTVYAMIKRLLDKDDLPLFKTFVTTFRTCFVKANLLGAAVVLIWAVLGLSWFFYLGDLETTFHWIGLVVVGFLAIGAFLMTAYLPISFVTFPRFKNVEHLRFALVMALGMPLATLLIALNTVFFYGVVMIRLVTVAPFLSLSLPAFVNLLLARKKLLGLFVVFADEQVTCRTLNSYPRPEVLWSLWQEAMEDVYPIDYETFVRTSLDPAHADPRFSLVLLDGKEEPVGCLLTVREEDRFSIQLLLVEKGYRRRGYGRRMIEALSDNALTQHASKLVIGSTRGYFNRLPRVFGQSLGFFEKTGFDIRHDEDGFEIDKPLKGVSA
ncbi:MAG: GNAT family N-acetyltransferase [Acholeplasmataceae bacterium]|nr:MAG: GNAT family N-acetyltransferase [Acholeplasmataceae bacterium]